MIEINLSEEHIEKLKEFLNSQYFNDKIEKSELWKHESHLANVEFKKNGKIILKGSGGLYFRKINPIKKFISEIKSKIYNYRNSLPIFPSYKNAFNQVMQCTKSRGELEYNFNLNCEHEIFKNYSLIKKNNPFTNFNFDYFETKHYYLFNILRSKINFDKINTILEIGGGSGHFPILIKNHHSNIKNYISVDLPEILIFNVIFMMHFSPNSKLCLPNQFENINDINIKNFDFVFLTPKQINLLSDNIVDLSINTSSFAEMNKKDILEYFDLVQKVTRKDGYFFNHNRVHKLPEPHSDDGGKIRGKLEANIFGDYPFVRENKLLIYDICRLSQYLKIDPMMVRLEKIIK